MKSINMKKQEALNKIAELKAFIEELDRKTITQFELGDIFRSNNNDNYVVILPFGFNTGRFCFGGLGGNPANPYNSGMDKGLTRAEVLESLNRTGDRVKVGKLSLCYKS